MYKQELFQCRELHKFRKILDNNYTDKAKIIHNQRQCDSPKIQGTCTGIQHWSMSHICTVYMYLVSQIETSHTYYACYLTSYGES